MGAEEHQRLHRAHKRNEARERLNQSLAGTILLRYGDLGVRACRECRRRALLVVLLTLNVCGALLNWSTIAPMTSSPAVIVTTKEVKLAGGDVPMVLDAFDAGSRGRTIQEYASFEPFAVNGSAVSEKLQLDNFSASGPSEKPRIFKPLKMSRPRRPRKTPIHPGPPGKRRYDGSETIDDGGSELIDDGNSSRCCLPRIPKTGSQSFWHLIKTRCATMAGHRVVNFSPHYGQGTAHFKAGNSLKDAKCPQDARTLRIMLFRDPVSHFQSLWSMHQLDPTYLVQLSLSPVTTRVDVSGLQKPSVHPMQLHAKLPELFFQPQTRFLLGYPLNVTRSDFVSDCPRPPRSSLPAGLTQFPGWWDASRQREPSLTLEDWSARIKNALLELDFFGLSDEFTKTLILLQSHMNWSIQTYEKVLHPSDAGYSQGVGKRRPRLSKTIENDVLAANYWDRMLHQEATRVFWERWHRFISRPSNAAWANVDYVCPNPEKTCGEQTDDAKSFCKVKCFLQHM